MTQAPAEVGRLEQFEKLFGSATQAASTAMGRWTKGQISLSLDEVQEIALEEVAAEFDLGDELLTMVVMSLQSELGGQMILTFDEENGRRLAATLLSRDINQEPTWSNLEKSALNETGNILSCAYLNTLTPFISRDLIPGPPIFIQDFGASVLEQAVMAQAMVSDSVLLCRTRFRRGQEELNWNVFFVPTHELLDELTTALQETNA